MKINLLILAGGCGTRMHSSLPKQFIDVDGKPVIVRTIENFLFNEKISQIIIVCLPKYIRYLKQIVVKYNLWKVVDVIKGGETGHDSSCNGVFYFKDYMDDDDYLIIHDAVRPILPKDILEELIMTGLKYGNACLAVPCYETVIKTQDGLSGYEEIDRTSFLRVQTPQIYKYSLIKNLYEKSNLDNIHNFIYANTMAIHYGVRIYFSRGFNYNFKITTPEDITFYKSLLNLEKKNEIK